MACCLWFHTLERRESIKLQDTRKKKLERRQIDSLTIMQYEVANMVGWLVELLERRATLDNYREGMFVQ